MPEQSKNLWAPWRMEYIRTLGPDVPENTCFLCHYWEHPNDDTDNQVLWRSEAAFAVMNRFPYTNGHLMVAAARHEGDMTAMLADELRDMTEQIQRCVEALQLCVQAQGFNVGMNLGLCAGAGLPGHLHAHIVPRWNGDTNYMAVIGDIRVVPESMEALYGRLTEVAKSKGWRP